MTTQRTVEFHAPLVKPALDALDEGRRPDDRTLRGAIRELREARKFIERKGKKGANENQLRQLDDWIDVLRWALRQPPDAVMSLCSRCRKRPPRFDALCGRCAEETGVRPRGKI